MDASGSPPKHRLRSVPTAIRKLRKRREFVAAARGRKYGRPAFLMQAIARDAARHGELGAGIGITVTRKIGNAVLRNRVRRRLRAALRAVAPAAAAAGFDYVVVARPAAHVLPFDELLGDLRHAFAAIHRPSRPRDRAAERPA